MTLAEIEVDLREVAPDLIASSGERGYQQWADKLSNEIRHARACAMLASRSQPVTQIAFRLGYKDVTSFNHAFRARSGKSPSDYRKNLRSGNAST